MARGGGAAALTGAAMTGAGLAAIDGLGGQGGGRGAPAVRLGEREPAERARALRVEAAPLPAVAELREDRACRLGDRSPDGGVRPLGRRGGDDERPGVEELVVAREGEPDRDEQLGRRRVAGSTVDRAVERGVGPDEPGELERERRPHPRGQLERRVAEDPAQVADREHLRPGAVDVRDEGARRGVGRERRVRAVLEGRDEEAADARELRRPEHRHFAEGCGIRCGGALGRAGQRGRENEEAREAGHPPIVPRRGSGRPSWDGAVTFPSQIGHGPDTRTCVKVSP